jgi:pSer/pThr/pTyr-binding forkhead associated (FHA) protein
MRGWILQSGDDPPIILRLTPDGVKTIGRAPAADFIVDAPLISRVHCRLTADRSDQLIVEDLGSTNGTIVNGRKTDRGVLHAGDRLLIGRVEFTVSRSPEA